MNLKSLFSKKELPAFENLSEMGEALRNSSKKEEKKDYKKETYAQYLSLFSLLFLVFYALFFLSPLIQEVNQEKSNIPVYLESLKVLENNNKLLEEYQSKNSDYKKLDILLKRSIPNKSDVDQSLYFFQKELLENNRLKGIVIESITIKDNLLVSVKNNKEVTIPLYKAEYTLTIKNVSSYQDAKGILEILEKNYRIYETPDFVVTPPDNKNNSENPEDNKLTVTIKLVAYYSKNAEPSKSNSSSGTGSSTTNNN